MVGSFRLDDEGWKHDRSEISSRAAFELKCAESELTIVPLATFRGWEDHANQVGVEGCGRRLVYVHSYASGWVLNSDSSDSAGSTR